MVHIIGVRRKFWVLYIASIISIFIFNYFLFQYKLRISLNSESCTNTLQQSHYIKYRDIEDITFITVPKPYSDPNTLDRNKLAIHSWLSVSNRSHVILFIKRSEFDPTDEFPKLLDDIYGSSRIKYLGNVKSDLKGIPYINSWFEEGFKRTESKYICFINGDIILSKNWLSRVGQVYGALKTRKVVIIGQRVDFDFVKTKFEALHYGSKTFLNEVDTLINECKHQEHSPFGVDTFTFDVENRPFNPENIPPFIIGRYNWDNWMVGWLNKISDTVTLNLNPPVYHINHQRHKFDMKDDRVAINHYLKKANFDYFGSNYDTKWEVVNDFLQLRNGTGKILLS